MRVLGLVGMVCLGGSTANAADVDLICAGYFKTVAEIEAQAPRHPVPKMQIMLDFTSREVVIQSNAFPLFENGYIAELFKADATSIAFYSKRAQRSDPTFRYLGAHLSRTTGDVMITISEGENDGIVLSANCRPARPLF